MLLLVPFRNEAANLPQLLPKLAQLCYPTEQLTAVLINDSSTDGSELYCQWWINRYPDWHLLSLTQNQGKASALNTALLQFPDSEFVAVFDADERPSPQTLVTMLGCLADVKVAAVNGRRAINNPLASLTSSYAAFENLVHQWVTVPAKDALHLAPPLLGSNCVYRRAALMAVGGFTAGTLLEDSDLTLKLTRAGWRIRYVPEAVSHHEAPVTIQQYWRQHLRWSTGFQDVVQAQATAVLKQKQLPYWVRLELLFFSLGYLDRVALVMALWGLRQRPFFLTKLIIMANLATPFLQIITALRMSQSSVVLWFRLLFMPLFFLVDIGATLASLRYKLGSGSLLWEKREPGV